MKHMHLTNMVLVAKSKFFGFVFTIPSTHYFYYFSLMGRGKNSLRSQSEWMIVWRIWKTWKCVLWRDMNYTLPTPKKQNSRQKNYWQEIVLLSLSNIIFQFCTSCQNFNSSLPTVVFILAIRVLIKLKFSNLAGSCFECFQWSSARTYLTNLELDFLYLNSRICNKDFGLSV